MGETNIVSMPMPEAKPPVSAPSTPASTTSQPTSPAPVDIPEKFKGDVGALAKAYRELEQKLGSQVQPAQPAKPVATIPPKPAETPAPETPKAPAGLSPEQLKGYTDSFIANGKLEDSHYSELAAVGISREMVDNYINGQVAIQAQRTEKILSAVGGPEQYETFVAWAALNYSEAEIAAYDQAVTSGDFAVAQQAVLALQARYKAANGAAPASVISGTPGVQGGVKGFGSTYEMTQAMRDKRYGKDPVYTAEVEARVAAM